MSPLEQQIAAVVSEHPEYHAELTAAQTDAEFSPEGGQSNPYLHMGLHLAIRDQVSTNRPAGIRQVFEQLATRRGDAHQAEHEMLECLAESLWQAQRDGNMPDEHAYLQKISALI